MRVAIFGSFYRGFYLLNELLFGPLSPYIRVVGVATDDASQPYVNPDKRVWQYPHTLHDEIMVGDLARQRRIPVYEGRVTSSGFHEIYERQWKPDLCVMATFGQKLDARLFTYPSMGFYNFQPSEEGTWPSRFAGANPFEAMLGAGVSQYTIVMHEVDAGIGTGALVALSERIAIPPHASVIDLHRASAPIAALLARQELARILGLADGMLQGQGTAECDVLHRTCCNHGSDA